MSEEPKYVLKYIWRLISHVIGTCALFNFGKLQLKNYSHLCLYSLPDGRPYLFLLCVKKLAKTVKSSLSNGHLKFWAGAHKLKANSKCFNLRGILCKIVGWPQKVGWPKKTFLEKVYQVDTSQNEKLETNTIRLFSDQLDLSTRSYAECAQKAHYFYRFFRFFSAEKLANFRFYFTILCGRFQWNFVPIWMI